MFFKFIIFFIFLIPIYYFFKGYRIKFLSFLKKGVRMDTVPFGVYTYVGKQGSGKTYSCVSFLLDNFKDYEIYSNVRSIKGFNYTYFNGLDNLLKLKNKKHIIIFYDEIFSLLTKNTKMTTDVLNFLSQMRKREIIFVTTAQEWLEINMTLRRYCRYKIDCRIKHFLGYNILIKSFCDAEQMKWSQIDNEYVCPLISCTISKINKYICDSYDTFEQIDKPHDFVFVENVERRSQKQKNAQ